MNSLDKIHIEIYGIDGTFQGYLSHLCESKGKVESTPNKQLARSFSTIGAASKIAEKVERLTNGCLRCNIA